MKKFAFLLAIAAFMASCTGNTSKEQTEETTEVSVAADTTTLSAVEDTTAVTEMAADSTAMQDSTVAAVQETDSVAENL